MRGKWPFRFRQLFRRLGRFKVPAQQGHGPRNRRLGKDCELLWNDARVVIEVVGDRKAEPYY